MEKLSVKLKEYYSKGNLEVPKFLADYAKIHRTPDIIPVMFKLAHANKNSNLDIFREIEMLKAIKTPVNKPLDWEHNREDSIGTIVKAFFVKVRNDSIVDIISSDDSQDVVDAAIADLETGNLEEDGESAYASLIFAKKHEGSPTSPTAKAMLEYCGASDISPEDIISISKGEKSFILALGVVWSEANKAKARQMVERNSDSELYWSMETFLNSYECEDCGAIVTSRRDVECDHLKNRFVTGTGRIVKDLIFAGAGVTTDPADSQASNVALGSKSKAPKESQAKKNTKVEVLADMENFMVFATEAEYNAHVDKLTDELHLAKEKEALEKEKLSLEEAIASLKEEVNSAKADIEAKESEFEAVLAEKDEKVKELESLVEDFKAKEKKALGEGRLAELRTAGLLVPDESAEKMAKELSDKSEDSFNMLLETVKASTAALEQKLAKANKDIENADDVADGDNPSIPNALTTASSNEANTSDVSENEDEDEVDRILALASRVR